MEAVSTQNLIAAFGLTVFAGLATGIGSAIALLAKQTNTKFLCGSLGFSAGVMIYVSFVEIFAKARECLCTAIGEAPGTWATAAAFFGGIVLIGAIDRLIPSAENPHEIHDVEEMANGANTKNRSLMRMGLFTALAIGIHNFPEGLATFVSALSDPALGIPIAIAIAIHNIPEGIAVSVPIYFATGSKRKAFRWSFLSGVAEPVGALVGYFFFLQFFSDLVFGITFAAVGGIMVFISLDELLPAAEKHGEHHIAIYALISGMAVMALSLLLFI